MSGEELCRVCGAPHPSGQCTAEKATEIVDILDCKPGEWHTVSETTNLGMGRITSHGDGDGKEEEITIEKGSRINVFVKDLDIHENPMHAGFVRIKIAPPDDGKSYHVEIAEESLAGKQVSVYESR